MSARGARSWCAALLAAAAFAGAPARAQVQRFDPRQDVGLDQRLGARLEGELGFTDSSGREEPLGSFLGARPVVLALVYYECPMLCTLVLNGLVRALRAIDLDAGADFEVVVVSIDPREGPELARRKEEQYVGAYGREGGARGWHFLTGREEAIRALADRVGFRYVYDEEVDEYAHASGIVLATPAGELSHYFYGVEYSAKDLRLALIDASRGRIGSPVDQILLLCFHYDPSTGKYGFAIVSALRIGGLLTVLLLFTFLVRQLLRERRSAARSAA